MQVRKQQLEPDMEQWTGSKLGKEYVKTVYCNPAYLTYMQSTSCINMYYFLGWKQNLLWWILTNELKSIVKFIVNLCYVEFSVNRSKTTVASLVAQMVSNLLAIQETQVWFLGWEDPLEKEMATCSSTLAENSMDRGVWQAIVNGVSKSRTWLCN